MYFINRASQNARGIYLAFSLDVRSQIVVSLKRVRKGWLKRMRSQHKWIYRGLVSEQRKRELYRR